MCWKSEQKEAGDMGEQELSFPILEGKQQNGLCNKKHNHFPLSNWDNKKGLFSCCMLHKCLNGGE